MKCKICKEKEEWFVGYCEGCLDRNGAEIDESLRQIEGDLYAK